MTASIVVRKASDRGHADHGWLDTRHTFSFAGYYDPRHLGFKSLLVLNEDRVSPGKGFGKHPHADMEIISYVVSGALEHQDSMGPISEPGGRKRLPDAVLSSPDPLAAAGMNPAPARTILKAGDVQRISAGRGVRHSEYNASTVEPVHFLQIWIEPDAEGVTPNYTEKSFADIEPGALQLIASKEGRLDSIPIHQDADVYVAKLLEGRRIDHAFVPSRAGWVQVIEGELVLGGEKLGPGDGASISETRNVSFTAAKDAHFLFFDLK